VIDLKIGDFEPEFAGKMSFYQAAVDNLIKTSQDAATIGIILCRGKNKTVVEYTLRDAKSPMGVAEYRLLPPKLKTQLPPVSQLKDAVTGVDVPDA
jgi:nuclease YhcG-like protein